MNAHTIQIPILEDVPGPEACLSGSAKAVLEAALPEYLRACRWFGAKARGIGSAKIEEVIVVEEAPLPAFITLVRIRYADQGDEVYVLPLAYATEARADRLVEERPASVVARLKPKERNVEGGVLYDAMTDQDFCYTLLRLMATDHRIKGMIGELAATSTSVFPELRRALDDRVEPSLASGEQSNTSVIFGKQFILKLFRRLQPGVNPDLEISRFLMRRGFKHIPPLAGSMEYLKGDEKMTLATLQGYVPNQGDAWKYTLGALDAFFERVKVWVKNYDPGEIRDVRLLDLAGKEPPDDVADLIGSYLNDAKLLGRRTAELHTALASDPSNPDFAPEPYSDQSLSALYQSIAKLLEQAFALLRRRVNELPEDVRSEAEALLSGEADILRRVEDLLKKRITAMRIRCHGDYHLGQVLHTGDDFLIIDFEGEPARPIGERRVKRSPMTDVAGMLRSFHYAAYATLLAQPGQEQSPLFESWALCWSTWVCAAFTGSYLDSASAGGFLPESADERRLLLDVHLLEKAVYELAYEINNRPTWIRIPLRGVWQLMREGGNT